MQDLDFDELDRAVNSLNMKTPVSDNSAANSNPNPIPSPSVPFVNQPSTSIPTIPQIERPSTGRFMDVVHPSSNMRANTVVPERPITPVPVIPVVRAPIARPVVNNPQPVITPDLDVEKISKEINRTLNQTPESPFLPDTKVDKRPLGAFSTEPTAITDEQVVESSDERSTMNIGNTPLPAELDDELLMIESDKGTNLEAEIIKDNKPTEKPILEPKSKLNTPTSISQQYTEKPNSDNQKTGAIYDTSSYHKVITRQPNKKSGWMWVLWIFLLLLAGAGAGVAFYFFVMPNLPKF